MRDMELKEQLLGSIKEGEIFHKPSRLRRKGVYLISPFSENVDAHGDPTPLATTGSAPPTEQMLIGHVFPSSPIPVGGVTGFQSPLSSLSNSSNDISSLCGQGETSPPPSARGPKQMRHGSESSETCSSDDDVSRTPSRSR